jgi:hypothetical protein
MITIKAEDIDSLHIGTICLQTTPCQHHVHLVLKNGHMENVYQLHACDLIRLWTIVKGPKTGCDISHFDYVYDVEFLNNTMRQKHKDKIPIKGKLKYEDCLIVYQCNS